MFNEAFSYQPVDDFLNKSEFKKLSNENRDLLTFAYLHSSLDKLINPKAFIGNTRTKLMTEENKMGDLLLADIREFLNKYKDKKNCTNIHYFVDL